jgi:hypothetical protein
VVAAVLKRTLWRAYKKRRVARMRLAADFLQLKPVPATYYRYMLPNLVPTII